MAIKKTPDEVARAEAIKALDELLIRNHVEPVLAAAQAQDFWREMTMAGWRHVRPRVDPAPPKGTPGDPDYRRRAAEWTREQIHSRREQASSTEPEETR